MDDQFMQALRAQPSPHFTEQLRRKLAQSAVHVQQPRQARWPKFVALAATLIMGVSLALVPSVRVTAKAFLDLFRVVNVAGVAINVRRMQKLGSDNIDLLKLLGEQVEVLRKPGESQFFDTPQAAARAANLPLHLPTWVPSGWSIDKVRIKDGGSIRVTANTDTLQQLLDTFDIHDLSVPSGLNGQAATVNMPTAMVVSYIEPSGERQVEFHQGPSPSVMLPSGVDLPMLAQIGLRIAGLERGDAYRIAMDIDWRTTLLVPVPTLAASFQQVDIQGNQGLLIQGVAMNGRRDSPVAPPSLLLWSNGQEMFALAGTMASGQLLSMAQSLQ
ncbi:MAG: hypothetical protein QM808_17235 [Steroidobacteraceae bacterium]